LQKHEPNISLIIEGCRQQNPKSQRKLYEYFYGFGMSVALRYSKNRVEAQEIFNDSFMKVFKNIERYDPDYDFKTWLKKIITNTAIDYFRKFKKHQYTFSTDTPPDSGFNEDFTEFDAQIDILPVVQALPPAYRIVFNLYVMEEYKHHEIAEILGISVGTSKSNLARAKDKLRKAIGSRENLKKSKSS